MKTYNSNQRSTFSAIVLTAVIALLFSVNVNAHTVSRTIGRETAVSDTGKMKMKEDKMKMKKKKAVKMDKMKEDKMKEDKMGSKM